MIAPPYKQDDLRPKEAPQKKLFTSEVFKS
jgi:hypothetical protein